jgi:hypothetical protein
MVGHIVILHTRVDNIKYFGYDFNVHRVQRIMAQIYDLCQMTYIILIIHGL